MLTDPSIRASECQTEHYRKKCCQQIARNMSRTHRIGAQIARGDVAVCSTPTTVFSETALRGAKHLTRIRHPKRSTKSESHSTEYTTAKNKRLVGLLSTDGSSSPQRASYAMRKECDQIICLWEPDCPSSPLRRIPCIVNLK